MPGAQPRDGGEGRVVAHPGYSPASRDEGLGDLRRRTRRLRSRFVLRVIRAAPPARGSLRFYDVNNRGRAALVPVGRPWHPLVDNRRDAATAVAPAVALDAAAAPPPRRRAAAAATAASTAATAASAATASTAADGAAARRGAAAAVAAGAPPPSPSSSAPRAGGGGPGVVDSLSPSLSIDARDRYHRR